MCELVCELCGDLFKSPSLYRQHKRRKTLCGKLCYICGRVFASSWLLHWHHVVHYKASHPGGAEVVERWVASTAKLNRQQHTSINVDFNNLIEHCYNLLDKVTYANLNFLPAACDAGPAACGAGPAACGAGAPHADAPHADTPHTDTPHI